MTQLPMSLAEIVQIWSSVKRIEKFLYASEMNPFYISYNSYSHHEKFAVSIQNGTFLWGAEKDDETKKKEEEEKEKEKEKGKEKEKK